jgi:hypothetical protein
MLLTQLIRLVFAWTMAVATASSLTMAFNENQDLNQEAEHRGLRRQDAHQLEHRQLAPVIAGTCTFFNTYTSTMTCVEFRGTNWTSATLQAGCQQLKGSLIDATFTVNKVVLPCPLPSTGFAGYCTVSYAGLLGAAPLGGDCTTNRNLCQGTLKGNFQASTACGGTLAVASAPSAPVNNNHSNVTGAFPASFYGTANTSTGQSMVSSGGVAAAVPGSLLWSGILLLSTGWSLMLVL